MGREWVWVWVQVRFDRADRGMFGIKVRGGLCANSDTGNIMCFN